MAVEFKWEVKGKYIHWEAKWDGVHNNDLIYDPGYVVHPFCGTGLYEQEARFQKRLKEMSEEEKNKDMVIDVVNESGEKIDVCNMGNLADANPEDHNPENIREIGDVCANNPVTVALCEMLSDPKEIKKHCGTSSAVDYRMLLFQALDLLWD